MIKGNELRLGSFIEHAHEGILKIKTLGERYFNAQNLDSSNFCFQYEDCDGIPLTPLLLTKCGMPHKGGLWSNSRLSLAQGNSGAFVIIGIVGSVSYLHQLQNLYFSLTGEELEINF